MNIYEGVNKKSELDKDVPNYFQRPVEFWDNIEAQLIKEGISFKLTTIRDDDFKDHQMGCYVRARISCMLTGRECHDDLERVRGFR